MRWSLRHSHRSRRTRPADQYEHLARPYPHGDRATVWHTCAVTNAPTNACDLPSRIDLRLVVTDMDGTLLDGCGQVPAGLPALVERLRAKGVMLCAASGRQLANLRETLGANAAGFPLIAENGTFLFTGEHDVLIDTLTEDRARQVITCVRDLAAQGHDIGAVVATPHCAYTERTDAPFQAQVATYYAAREQVGDLLSLPLTGVLKIAVYDFGDSETGSAPLLAQANPDIQAVVSSHHWTDLMPPQASKGRALAELQRILGITAAQTAVFGDYLNDLELYPYAELSFAMANAHSTVLGAARYTAPANTADGVVRTVSELLDRTTSCG